MQERYDETVAIFTQLVADDDSPQFTQQWLGYYLLWIEGREKEAIQHSESYFSRFPSQVDAIFNIACGYAQLYSAELRIENAKEILSSENRRLALDRLGKAIRIEVDVRRWAKSYSAEGDSFEALAKDLDFIRLTLDTDKGSQLT
jgi:tetratricopeptide (TPR) repeat protein